MTAEQFAYWLQGFSEINGRCPNDAEWTIIQDHLKTVFTKVTPNRAPAFDPTRPYTSPPVQDQWGQMMRPLPDRIDTQTIC